MTRAGPRDSTIAIVGDGFGSSLVYSTAVYLGFRPEQVTVLGPNASPVDPTRLAPGHQVRVGDTTFKVEGPPLSAAARGSPAGG